MNLERGQRVFCVGWMRGMFIRDSFAHFYHQGRVFIVATLLIFTVETRIMWVGYMFVKHKCLKLRNSQKMIGF